MARTTFIETVGDRSNPIKAFIYGLFRSAVCMPRLLLEVFTRTNFGERYFSYSRAWIYAFMLGFFPLLLLIAMFVNPWFDFTIWSFILHYASIYVFLVFFLKRCMIHRKEIQKHKKNFNYKRYSRSAGSIDDRLLNFKYKGRSFSPRTVQTIIEPGLFFCVGLGLMILSQALGVILVYSSICYSISYFDAYRQGDNMMMDIIDFTIRNEEMRNIVEKHMPPKKTQGYEIYADPITDPEVAKKVSDKLSPEEKDPTYVL